MEKKPSRPFLLLSDIVKDYSFVDKRPFRKVECRRKDAYGCGPNGDGIVKGLSLYVRLGRDDDPNNSPELCISATDEVFRHVGSELDVEKAERYGTQTDLSCRIYTVDGDVMVLRLSFVPTFVGADVAYYLVYDSTAASLSLLPGLLPCCRPVCTEFPLKVKGRQEDKYSLVFLAERSEDKEPVLCLWSATPSIEDSSRRDMNCAWGLKGRLPVKAGPFEAHVVFTYKGNALWCDLSQGILYCDCRDLIDGPEPVNFKHIMLPEECRTRYDKYDFNQIPMLACRNIGCVGDSIWFVIIESSFSNPGATEVKVWTLDLLSVNKWSLHRVFQLQNLWKLELFRAMGLPKVLPDFPILRQRDDRAIYMLLRKPYKGGGVEVYGHLVCVDLSLIYKPRLLSKQHLCVPLMERPLVLDPDFFTPMERPVGRDANLFSRRRMGV